MGWVGLDWDEVRLDWLHSCMRKDGLHRKGHEQTR